MASSIKRKAKVITNKDDLDMIVNMTTEEALFTGEEDIRSYQIWFILVLIHAK